MERLGKVTEKAAPGCSCSCWNSNSYANAAEEAALHREAFVRQVEQRPKQNWQLRTENFNNSTAQSGKSHSLNDADEILMKYRFMQKPHTLTVAGDTHNTHSHSHSVVVEVRERK